MLLKPLTIAAAGLAGASALLIPPEIAETAGDIVNALPFEVPKIAEDKVFNLNCPGCPMQLRGHHGKMRVKQGIKNHLELSFGIDHLPTHDRLLLNGFELYPNPDPRASVLTAPQIADFEEGSRGPKPPKPFKMIEPATPRLGFSLQAHPVAVNKAEKMALVALEFQTIEVGNSFVDGIPNVSIKLIKSEDGALMIGDIQATESQTIQSNPMDKQEECTTIVCKWRAIVMEQINRTKGHKCGKMGKMGHHKGAGHHRPHHHHEGGFIHRPKFHEHSWGQLFKKFGSHILFPILIGIVAGVSVSIIGMVVGTLIVGLWRVFVRGQPFFPQRRRHSRGHSHHKAALKEAAPAEEKSSLMDSPPSYEEDNKADA